MVKMTIDPDTPPKPSTQALARFDAIRDRDIDYSDIPELGDIFFHKARKQSVTAHLIPTWRSEKPIKQE